LLDDLGTEPSAFDAIGLREFLLRRVSCFSQEKSKNLATAVRMFLPTDFACNSSRSTRLIAASYL
jgi:hypothetical protein